ncbi:hypothetical protein OHB12_04715 [Nocardia sp. NBC_01730]|uniref:hypothetical protein n=1 Tax=Nocardia sp. NBC_01730 TaxID=2975998 RepID=UPI002E114DF6|nr:hypothetical protein OHB12_04715 [Nocardia sp. NBC_01730]
MMKSHRLLIILLAGITAVVVAAFVLTVTSDTGRRDIPASPGGMALPTERTFPDLPPAAAQLPPTTDVFGNRLEVPNAESGVALLQDSATRPDPARSDNLTAAPARMQWQRGWGGAALPVSGSDGPERIHDGIATGFAHTPQGAALAACDALARALSAPDGVWQKVVRERYYGGGQALLDRFSRSRARTPGAARYVVVPDGIRIQPGYRDDLAVVQFATRGQFGYTIATWPMAWIDGDWRVRVPEDIEILWGPGTYTATLTGFGSWKTVS